MGLKERIIDYIKIQERKGYINGLPDEAPAILEEYGKVPSYRRICLAIMKNDVQLQTLGYSRKPCSAYMELKRIEIEQRTKKNITYQLKLF